MVSSSYGTGTYFVDIGMLQNLLSKADADGSGSVTWDEFLKVLEKRPIKKRM